MKTFSAILLAALLIPATARSETAHVEAPHGETAHSEVPHSEAVQSEAADGETVHGDAAHGVTTPAETPPAETAHSAPPQDDTEWMGDSRQWAVGYVAKKPAYCRLVWDSELGKTVEFRQSLDNVLWLLSKDGWDIPKGTVTKVTMVGRAGSKAVPAEFFDGKTLRIVPSEGRTGVAQIKAILKNSFIGTPDMEIRFSGDEEKWVVPLSRAQQMYTTYVDCLNRLVPGNTVSQVSEKTQPF
jgi:hypothetical protein